MVKYRKEEIMTWVYKQSTGDLSQNTVAVGRGYSGTGGGRNNGEMQNIRDVGPIPQGTYTIGAPHNTTTHGPFVMRLTPSATTQTFQRDGFLIHGDNRRHDASHGCIIVSPQIRHRIWSSGDRTLEVVP
jgi:hypothetical protein